MFQANYARIELRYHEQDLLAMPVRRVLNIAYEFLVEAHQFKQDEWDRDWAPLFEPESADQVAPEVQAVWDRALSASEQGNPVIGGV